ncbi:tetratricopeptide repeat protein [Pontibacter sp. 172403-2]|uniref:type IX secretion system periplasmic lipoprotein PorW/SprE n=1 Tax=Pontibacter rufus TaxID=2791028 RepID=UPI0018AF7A29|nr:tetratricopeptide repeat protein [Pontibacter sp. 172403-2]MBF9252915.1 tetratricopeptide repeat protein [Pontibacter sp. 172403-2]
MNKQPLHLLLLLPALLLLGSCSVERNNPLSKTYHNTTARYNGYFLAKEKMRAVQESLQQQTTYDYNQVLPIYPAIDSVTAKAMAADLEDIIKKASFPIQWHKNSKWIDDSYVLIGQAQFYQLNFAEASKTFKYANTIGKDKDARHEALVWLMRSFMKLNLMDDAQAVSEYLRKERLNKDNARALYLARAQYNTLLGDTAAVIENLALALPNFEDKDNLKRTRFTLAQLYQLTGQNEEAYAQYSQVLRKNPPYDLGFFSRLNLGQVAELSDAEDLERMASYYQKMLKDDKNKEYRDKIYYEMAQFELRQQHYDKALEYLQQSLKTPGTLPNQKAYSYVAAGEIYFDKLNKYNLAEAYYDSAVQVYPQTALNYEAVRERRDVLADFAKQYNTIQTQDSLLRLAHMSEAERTGFVKQLVQREEELRQQELAQQEAAQQRNRAEQPRRSNSRNNQNGTAFPDETTDASGIWYFDNPAAMASARSEFIRRWGDRPLQDFWRIRTRGESNQQAQPAEAPVVADATPASEEAQLSPEERANAQVQAYLQNIPVTTADMQRAEKQIEEALFNLANIYALKLNDIGKATQTYQELLQRFPRSEHAAETYYSLYLLYSRAGDEPQKQAYYNRIRQEFPNTTYARLVDDPDFMSKNAADNLKAHMLYDAAYTYYEEQDYKKAAQVLDQVVSRYPLSDIQDKVAFLEAMITARTKPPQALREQLQRFKTNFPGSTLQPQADALLATYTTLEQNNQLRQEAPSRDTTPKATTAGNLRPEEKVATAMAAFTVPDEPAAPPKPVAPPVQQPLAAAHAEEEPVAATKEAAPASLPVQPVQEATAQQQQPTPPVASNVTADTVAAATLASPPVAAKDPLAYEATPDTAYYFVLVYPPEVPAFKDIAAKYSKYNSTYHRNLNLQADSIAAGAGKAMLVLGTFTDPKVALAYNIKQKGPQAPVGRIRGVEFTTFVITAANYQKFLQKKDVEAYLTFFKNNY